MSVESTVRWLHFNMEGAPVIHTGNDRIINALDAILINGFTPKAASSLVVADGVATVTFGSSHKFPMHSVIEVTGATPAELNDVWRATGGYNTTTLTFNCPGIPDGAASGTINVKIAPIPHWEKRFSASGKAVYRNTHPNSFGRHLRVVENVNEWYASFRGYIDMTDIDTGTGEYPTVAQRADGNFMLQKGHSWIGGSGAGPNLQSKPWHCFGDIGGIFFGVAPMSYDTTYRTAFQYLVFLDFLPFDPADQFAHLIYAEANLNSWPNALFCTGDTTTTNRYAPKNFDGSVSSVLTAFKTLNHGPANTPAAERQSLSNDEDWFLYPWYMSMSANASSRPRAIWPGLLGTFAGEINASENPNELFFIHENGRVYKKQFASNSSSLCGTFLFDLTGPWRDEM